MRTIHCLHQPLAFLPLIVLLVTSPHSSQIMSWKCRSPPPMPWSNIGTTSGQPPIRYWSDRGIESRKQQSARGGLLPPTSQARQCGSQPRTYDGLAHCMKSGIFVSMRHCRLTWNFRFATARGKRHRKLPWIVRNWHGPCLAVVPPWPPPPDSRGGFSM